MALYLSESDVVGLASVEDALLALETVFAEWGTDGVDNAPRQRIKLPQRAMNLMGASWGTGDVCGHKSYFSGCFYVSLYSISQKRQLALIEANKLGAMRTGAASGLATKVLARADAKTLGIIGTGRQSRTQVLAIAAVRNLETVRVFGRDEARRTAFAAELAKELECEVIAATSAEACIRGADIAVTMTNSTEPVLFGEWLSPGTHVNATGANGYARRELDDDAVMRAALVSTDQREQAKTEARELIDLTEAGKLAWDEIAELGALVRGDADGRRAEDQITLFKSLGLALEDIAFAKLIYERALATGKGQTFGPQTE
jgi:ornithine cyclodeaminase/alanine dehydrogenase-like protein (mu-crystallin family)